jgi:hypothetical protein
MFKRKLNRVETIALSVAVIAMMVGMSLNTPFIAGTAGTAIPLAFVVSTIGVLCIALSFVRLASKVGHAGVAPAIAEPKRGPNRSAQGQAQNEIIRYGVRILMRRQIELRKLQRNPASRP